MRALEGTILVLKIRRTLLLLSNSFVFVLLMWELCELLEGLNTWQKCESCFC